MTKKIKNYNIILIILVIVFTFASCSKTDSQNLQTGNTKYPISIIDDLGNNITVDKEPMRIISSSPAVTEILFALGLNDKITGVSSSCDWPEQAKSKPQLFEYAGPDIENIIASEPDIILSDVAYGIPRDVQTLLEKSGIKIVLMTYTSVEDVLDNIELIGKITNKNKEATKLAQKINNSINQIKSLAVKQSAKSVFIDIGGFYTPAENTYMCDLINIIGAQNIAEDLGKGWVIMPIEKLVEKNPDIYIDLSVAESSDTPTDPIAAGLPAVKEGHYYSYSYQSNETSILSRPGPRIEHALQLLYDIVYEEEN